MSIFEDVKNGLREMTQDDAVLKQENDLIDNMLLEIIKIERRHLYGLERTSVVKRRKDIESFLDTSFDQYREYKNET